MNSTSKKILITGGAGFIGSALIRYLVEETDSTIFNLDKLTYAGNLESLHSISDDLNYNFIHGDILDKKLLAQIFIDYQPDYVIHLAAESHVDRSIDRPLDFIYTNIVGTSILLDCSLNYWQSLDNNNNNFRFLHISTDEVFGSLSYTGLFTEKSPYDPSSPYSASKASSDHLVRAWYRTYGLPVLITNCSNNYGPYQFPEKLIPLMVLNALEGKLLPIYGNGQQVRDWLYVEDHVRALYEVVTKGEVGQTYNIGGHNEKTNLEVVHALCEILDDVRPDHLKGISSYKDLITFVDDRPGHDQRYAIDASKIHKDLDWTPAETFETGLRKTVEWYLNNPEWCKHVQDGSYQRQRLGVIESKQGAVT